MNQEGRIPIRIFSLTGFHRWTNQRRPPMKHRELTSDPQRRSDAIEKIADWLLCHHISEDKLNQLKVKRRILKKYGFKEFVDSQSLLPKLHTTQKGNCAEVILSEYLVSTSGLDLLIYRLYYNTNIELFPPFSKMSSNMLITFTSC